MKTIPLTQNQLAIVDDADYESLSAFKWCAHWCRETASFYALRTDHASGKSVTVRMHRVILGLSKGDGRQGDHINHDTLDNTRHNLRIVTRSQNSMNQRRNSKNTSGFKGVGFCSPRGKWRARIRLDRKRICLGHFATPELAHAAYCAAALMMHGEYANFGGRP